MKNLFAPVIIIFIAACLRLIPHPANVAPIAAMALFGGVYVNKRYALVIPLLAMLLSDMFLGFHDTMVFVYGSFLLTGLIGLFIKHHKTPFMIIGGSVVSSLLFFFITNFGVWLVGTLYPHTLFGLLASYTAGLPFLRNTLFGDLGYTGLLFGSYELAVLFFKQQKYSYGK